MTPEQFKQLTKAEQRVAIAKDVIAQVKVKRYKPSGGAYIILEGGNEHLDKEPIQENINKLKECEVCAIGSAILSIAKYKNTIRFNEVSQGLFGFSDRA